MNTPNTAEIRHALQTAFAMLQAIDADKLASAELVPLVNDIKNIAAYVSAIDAQIQTRAVANGELLPGVIVETSTTHRAWSEPETAAELAQSELGDDAFTRKLKSPAQIEKMGAKGKAFVAVASYKPEGSKRAVY